MKSAEEWYSEGGWNTDSNSVKSIKDIQHDAWKQGMTDAAVIVKSQEAPMLNRTYQDYIEKCLHMRENMVNIIVNIRDSRPTP